MSQPKKGDFAAYLAQHSKADEKQADSAEQDTEFSTEFSTEPADLGDEAFDDLPDISDADLEQQALDHGGGDDDPSTPE
jgi:hypothetical protein